MRFELVTLSVTFPAHSASLLSSVPGCLTNWSGFIISGVGTSSVPCRTWKLNIWTWSCFMYKAAFISHWWNFSVKFLLCFVVVGDLFSYSKEGLCQASMKCTLVRYFPVQLISLPPCAHMQTLIITCIWFAYSLISKHMIWRNCLGSR